MSAGASCTVRTANDRKATRYADPIRPVRPVRPVRLSVGAPLGTMHYLSSGASPASQSRARAMTRRSALTAGLISRLFSPPLIELRRQTQRALFTRARTEKRFTLHARRAFIKKRAAITNTRRGREKQIIGRAAREQLSAGRRTKRPAAGTAEHVVDERRSPGSCAGPFDSIVKAPRRRPLVKGCPSVQRLSSSHCAACRHVGWMEPRRKMRPSRAKWRRAARVERGG